MELVNILKSLFEQTSWQIVGKGLSVLSTLLILGLITRTYGADGTGIYSLANAYLAFFFLVADLGLNSYFLAKVTKNHDEASKLFSFRLFWSFFLIIVANALVPFLPFSNGQFKLAVLVGSVAIVFNGIIKTAGLLFQERLRFDQAVYSAALGSAAAVIVVYFLVINKVQTGLLTLGPTVNWFVNSLVAVFLVNRFFKFRLQVPNLKDFWADLKLAWPISLTLILNVVYFRVDSFILSSVKNFSDVGIYGLSYQIFQTILFLPTFIMNGYFPVMIKLLEENKEKFYKQIRFASLGMLGLGVLATVFSILLSPFIISVIAGKGFEGSVGAYNILSLGYPAFFISSLLMWLFITLGQYKRMLFVYVFGLLINFILNLILIPKYSYIGAAYVTGISEYLILILQIIILWKDFKGK